MLKLIKILNWSYIAFFAVAIASLYRMNPMYVNPGSFAIFVPCAIALIGLRRDSRKVALWFALVVNGLYFLLSLSVAVFTTPARPSAMLGVFVTALITTYGLNAWWFGRTLFGLSAKSQRKRLPESNSF